MGISEWREGLRREALRLDGEVAMKVKGTVFLVGSYARGDFGEDSDVDVLIIGEFSEPPHRRLLHVVVPAELIALTVEEALRIVEKCYPLAQDIALGIVVKDDLLIAERLISAAKRCVDR